MDNKAINKIMIKYRFPFIGLIIDDLFDTMARSSIFFIIYFRSRYHRIRIYEGDGWEIDFKTRDCLYEWLSISFELSNAPSI